MSSAAKGPVRLVLFDIFDTLCTPRIPIHEQYHEEGIRAGLPSDKVTPDSVRSAFKPAFKAMEARWPVYGKHSTPALSPEQWWTELIKQCMLEAGAAEKEVEGAIPTLAPALLSRFESKKGYRPFPETLSSLRKLKESSAKISIVSNADPRILRTIDALGISPYLTHPPTLSWEVEVGKPDRRIFEAACRACGETPGQGILFVGDELKADYHGSTDAGLEARLIRRQGSWSDGANRSPGEDLVGVHCVETLEKIVAEVEERNHGG